MPGSERRSCSAAEAHAAARDPMDRRHSTSSESSLPEAPHFRQSSQENIEYIPTRTSKVTASKPAANPLQFVKVGPCDLYRSAQEQIRKVEEVKKIKQEKRDEAEDWQSNLDNWKSSRRKRQEHIIERVVEVKKFELEEYDRNRRRSKTFNEMMEERNSRGRKVSLVMFKNDDMNDLSDLGIGPTSAKSSICGDNDHINELNLTNKEEADCRQFDNHNFENNSNGMIEVHDNNFHSEAEEYTYERAIQSYVNFAETRVKSKSPGTNSYNEQNENLSRMKETSEAENGNIPNGHEQKKVKIPPPLPAKPKKGFEIRRQSSGDLNCFPDNSRKLPLPKVDVLKKREIFEKAAEASNLQTKIPSDFSISKSIKNRVFNIENKNEVNNQSADYVATVHERIASIKKQNSFDNVNEKEKKTSLRFSDNDKNSLNSVKDSISRIKKDLSNGSDKDSNHQQESWKDINSNLKVAGEIPTNDVIRDSVQNQHAHYVKPNNEVKELEHNYVHPVKCFTTPKSKVVSVDEDLLQSKPKFHRSLDSLDMDGSSGCGNETFERVQSLEDLECCSHTMNYPPSSSSTEMFALSCHSGDTDREDSGIHTADVSCSVSQADEPVEDGEIVTMISSVIPHLVLDKNGKKDYHLEVQLVQCKQADDSTIKSECAPSCLSENSLITSLAMLNLSEKSINESSTSHNSVAVSVPLDPVVVVPECAKTLVSSEKSNISDVIDVSEFSPDSQNAVECINGAGKNTNSEDVSEFTPDCRNAVECINGAGKNTNSEDHACRSLLVPQSEFSSELDINGGSSIRVLNSEGGVDASYLSTSVIKPFYHLQRHSMENTNQSELNIIDPLSSTDNEVYIEESQECKIPEPLMDSTETIFNDIPTVSTTDGVPSCQDNAIMVHVHDNSVTSLEKRRTVVEVFEEFTLDLDNGDKRILPTPFFSLPMHGVEIDTIAQKEVIVQGELGASGSSQTRIDKVPINLNPETPSDLKKDNLEVSYYGNKDNEEDSIIPAFTNQIPPLSLSGEIEIVDGLPFPLGTLTSAEPPKEKPPPPPEYLSDEDAVLKESTLRRLDSTKRIKKEIRRKRSDFLGIEGKSDDSYLEPELQVAPPPDMTSFLMEEQRHEKELYRQSICSESDSNHGETTESRDSGVELEKGISDDTWPTKQLLTPDVLSTGHSRQNSEIFGNASMTSEEDEITKKEREIIEILEKEEQWRYGTQQNHIGEKLAEKLRLLEEEKMRLEWERAEEANRRESEELARIDEELRLKNKEAELRQQETTLIDNCDKIDVKEGDDDGAALQSERTRLQKQQEELVRQQESLLHAQCWGTNVHSSLQDVSCKQPSVNTHPPVVYSYRYSLPDLQQEPEQNVAVQQLPVQPLPRTNTSRYAPPPIPPAKPVRNNQEQREREHSIRNSRMPSADCIPKQLENSNASLSQATGQQMSKQTRQALSAAPRPRFISTDNWIQAKKKPEVKRNSLNNHHWLIQEAEHRRITEQQHRNAMSPRKVPPPHPEVPQLWAQKQQQPVQRQEKPLPDSIIQTLTQRVQNRVEAKKPIIRPRVEESPSRDTLINQIPIPNTGNNTASSDSQEKILSVSGKKKCSHCGDELGRGAAMIIESLRLFYHIDCFKCCVCHVQLGDGLMGTDVRVRNNKLHCHNCYSSDDGVKFSCV